MLPNISILVPVYNVEPYLQRCIDSVLAQDFQDWEMILVDDGSPDRCPEICDEAGRKDERISVIHKKNGGLVSARREGVRNSRGEYLMFLDSDDMLTDGALGLLYKKITEGYDMVRGNAYRLLPSGDYEPLQNNLLDEFEIVGGEAILYHIFTGKVPTFVWGTLYRKSLFKDSYYEDLITERISYGEDLMINLLIAKQMNKVYYMSDFVYFYFYNETSITGRSICSDVYGERMDKILMKYGITDSEIMKKEYKCMKALAFAHNFFVPEFGWDKRKYNFIREVLLDEETGEIVRQRLNGKYLRFVNIKWLYFIYSVIYRFLFKTIKLKGKLRRVIS